MMVESLLDTKDHYTALLKGLVSTRHAKTLEAAETRYLSKHGILDGLIQIKPTYGPRSAFARNAASAIRASEAHKIDKNQKPGPSPLIMAYQ